MVSAAGGLLLGMAFQALLVEGVTGTLLALMAGGGLLFGVSFLLLSAAIGGRDVDLPLPGELYAGTQRPTMDDVRPPELMGRVPFSVGKGQARPAPRSAHAEKLHNELSEINRQLQRAAVKLGLNQLSHEGYTLIVNELKKRRARIERQIAQGELGPRSGKRTV